MQTSSRLDAQTIADIRLCLSEITDRGLIIASKWLSELLLSIRPSKRNTAKSNDLDTSGIFTEDEIYPKWLTREEIEAEEREADVLNVARKCMEARQYHRAAHFLRNCTSAKARFVNVYCRFITSEKKALHEWHKSDNTRHQPPLPVNDTITDLLDLVQHSSDPWLQFLEAIFLHRFSRIPQALAVLYSSLSACPWNWSAWMLFGQCLDSAEALTNALPNLNLPPDHPLFQMFQLKIMNELHTATNTELQICDRLLSEDFFPRNLWLMGQRGRVLYDTLEFTQAQDQFSRMFTLDPNRIEDLDVYSNILHLLEKHEELTALAERFLRYGSESDKNRPEVCCIVGNHYSLRGERDKAIKYFRRATLLDRTCLTAWTLMGLEYHEVANHPAAIESFRKALDINKKDSRPWAGLGAAYDAMSMPLYSLFYFQQAIKLRPNEPTIWEGLGICYEGASKYFDSIISFKHALELLRPSEPLKRRVDIRSKIARLYRIQDQVEESVKYEAEIIKLCDAELIDVNLRPSFRDILVEQYFTSIYNVAEYNESSNLNLKLAYDYYTWLMALGNSNAPRLKASVLEQIKSRALLMKGCHLTDEDSPKCGYALDYKEGRCLLLEYLRQQGIEMAE